MIGVVAWLLRCGGKDILRAALKKLFERAGNVSAIGLERRFKPRRFVLPFAGRFRYGGSCSGEIIRRHADGGEVKACKRDRRSRRADGAPLQG